MYRVGISGVDDHNGGLIGAIQFLGGNRITNCFFSNDFNNFNIEYIKSNSITVYNCFLSIISMFIISLFSIIGAFILIIKIDELKMIIMPLMFSIITFVSIFQQSLSVHLMGYSYIFTFIFSTGFIGIFFLMFYKKYDIMRLLISIPFIFGVIILSVRVSLLTGING